MNITYIRSGDYYIPDLTLPEESRPIGRWGRMHRDYLREHKPIQYKADFAELYQALNEMPLQEMDWIINPVCALCRDHERNGFVHGVQLGAQLVQEIQSDK